MSSKARVDGDTAVRFSFLYYSRVAKVSVDVTALNGGPRSHLLDKFFNVSCNCDVTLFTRIGRTRSPAAKVLLLDSNIVNRISACPVISVTSVSAHCGTY